LGKACQGRRVGNGNVYISGDQPDAWVSWRREDLRIFSVARQVRNNCVLAAAAAYYQDAHGTSIGRAISAGHALVIMRRTDICTLDMAHTILHRAGLGALPLSAVGARLPALPPACCEPECQGWPHGWRDARPQTRRVLFEKRLREGIHDTGQRCQQESYRPALDRQVTL
jgi:hypothetical protein